MATIYFGIFEWDSGKNETNRAKHGLDFEQASQVFGDPLHYTFPDALSSIDEGRWITLGRMADGRVLFVVTAERERRLRIISARLATRSEIRRYESED